MGSRPMDLFRLDDIRVPTVYLGLAESRVLWFGPNCRINNLQFFNTLRSSTRTPGTTFPRHAAPVLAGFRLRAQTPARCCKFDSHSEHHAFLLPANKSLNRRSRCVSQVNRPSRVGVGLRSWRAPGPPSIVPVANALTGHRVSSRADKKSSALWAASDGV